MNVFKEINATLGIVHIGDSVKIFVLFILILFSTTGFALAKGGIFTDLSGEACLVVSRDEGSGISTRRLCQGVGAYKLAILSVNNRVSIDVIYPNGKVYPLNFQELMSGFMSLGEQAEWRILSGKRLIPKALIVEVKVYEDSENPEKFMSYLFISKIIRDGACVTDMIPSGPQQNIRAGLAADSAVEKPWIPGGAL